MSEKINAVLGTNFVEEMLRLAFNNLDYAKLVCENLDVSNFPRQLGGCKAMLKVLNDIYRKTGKLATYGSVEMEFPNNEEVRKKIEEVRSLPVPDYGLMVSQLETFVRRQTFISVQNEISEMYNSGRMDEAMILLEKKIREVNSFSFEGSKSEFSRVYRDFYSNMEKAQKQQEDENRRAQMPLGITSIDNLTDGGIPRQDTALWIMRSGVGKSTVLKFIAWYNTSIAHNHVLHIQLEGGMKECVIKFNQMIAHTAYGKILKGDLSEETEERIKKIISRAAVVDSDIDVYASEEMMDMTISELNSTIERYFREHGYYPDLITIDSLDLMVTGENNKIDFDPSFIKYRLQRCAQKLKDIAKKYDCAIVTATQTSEVPFEIWNDPSKVITRSNTEGDRTLVKPFSFVFTGNITLEESRQNVCRIYFDKLRNYKNNGIIAKIPTDYEHGFFYDMPRSRTEECVLEASTVLSDTEKVYRRGKKDSKPTVEQVNLNKVQSAVDTSVSKRSVIRKKKEDEV